MKDVIEQDEIAELAAHLIAAMRSRHKAQAEEREDEMAAAWGERMLTLCAAEDRAFLADALLRSLPRRLAGDAIRQASERLGDDSPLPAAGDVVREARFWAHTAPTLERRAYLWEVYKALPAKIQRAFLDRVSQEAKPDGP